MNRRKFLKIASMTTPMVLAAGSPLARAVEVFGGRTKIKSVRNQYLRIEKELGSYIDYVGRRRSYRIGGGGFCVIQADSGETGFGGLIPPNLLGAVDGLLVGADPFDAELLASRMKKLGPDLGGIEVALWDLIGKLANQPLYKLWGGGNGRDFVTPYSSHLLLDTPQRRGALAAKLKSQGWKGMKVKAHFPTIQEDIALCEEIRRQAGDDFIIMVDGNKADLRIPALYPNHVPWSYRRAYETAKAYEALNVYFLEEPLPRDNLRQLAELNRSTSMFLAGGEANEGLDEFKALIDNDCFDILQPEIDKVGVSEFRKLLVMAEADYRMVIPHLGDGRFSTACVMHLAASATNVPFVEMGNEQPIGDYRSGYAIFENPPLVRADGTIKLPDGPGLGLIPRQDLFCDRPEQSG